MNEELERAEALLRHAERELNESRVAEEAAREQLTAAESVERVALREMTEALEEIHEVEEQCLEIHFTVDGEPYVTEAKELTPNVILKDFAGRDPANYYLVRIEGAHKESYKDKGNDPIRMHDGMRFQAVYVGATPVSDDTGSSGFRVFSEGLRALGYDPNPVVKLANHLTFDYTVETGAFAGRTVRLGFSVPPDFPNTPPSGPYVSPHVRPVNPIGPHPSGGIHAGAHAQPFATNVGGDWQYWSRPFVPVWAAEKKTVATYMSHIWRLWDTQ